MAANSAVCKKSQTRLLVTKEPAKSGRRASCGRVFSDLASHHQQTRQRDQGEAGAGQECPLRPCDVPERAGNDAGGEHRHTAEQVEESISGAAQLGRRGIRNKGGQQSLRQPHVQAPENDTQRYAPSDGSSASTISAATSNSMPPASTAVRLMRSEMTPAG